MTSCMSFARMNPLVTVFIHVHEYDKCLIYQVLSMINIIGGCLQLVVSYIGPERFADPVEKCRNQCYEWTAEKLVQAKRFFCGGNDD